MKKLVLTVGLLLGVGYGAYRLGPTWRASLPGARPASEPPKTAVVIQTNINFAVSAAGEISPAEQVSVRPEINGRIERLPVDVGDRVRKNDLLFALDDKELQQQKAAALTSIERAQLELDQAKRNYQRSEELFAENLISRELYENAKTTFDLAKNSLERAQRELALIEERLTKTQVVAPFDCTVLTRPVSIGQAVSGSGGFNSGTEVLTIADLNSMVINAHINQADVSRLQVNQVVEVAVEAVSGLTVTGVVERIAPQATIRNNIKGFAARILLRNVDPRVRPGMTANIKIPVASADNVLAVPLAAVFTEKDPETGQYERFVYVARSGSFEKRPVRVGVTDYFFAEIQEGLSPGEVVALELPKEQRTAPGNDRLAGTRAGAASASPTLRASATPTPAGSTNRPAASGTGPAASRPGGGGSGGSAR